MVSARAEHGVWLEDGVARLARNRLKQLVKEMEASGETRGRGQAAPLLVEHLVKISAACPDNLRGIRDRALVLMHFAVAGREHDLAFNRVRDYAETPGGIQADLRVSKVCPRVVFGPLRLTALSLPRVRAWQAWKEAAGLTDPDGYAWRRLHNRWNTVMDSGLQPEPIGDIVTRAGERAGIAIRFTGHSPRCGLTASSRLKGHDQIVIARQGGWAPHSKVLAGYLEVVDQWEDNALLDVL
ncbi:integrase [Streptomyces sp. NPDC051310]|uniref:integrase n=1 Tax=Streptomyces sp. NPDC051310 TaxID=3365649 RepID=UPI0037A29254